MKLLIDSVNVKSIGKLMDYYPIDGITSNPSVLFKEGRQPYEVLKEIRSLIGDRDLHVQVVSETAEEMMKEAEKICSVLGPATFIKIPVTFEGVKAIKLLTEKGYNCTGTVVYTEEQAFMAAKAGAKWVAPYVNRVLQARGEEGMMAVSMMRNAVRTAGNGTGILAASLHTVSQIAAMVEMDLEGITVSDELLLTMLNNPTVDKAVKKFREDFETLCGKSSTMLS